MAHPNDPPPCEQHTKARFVAKPPIGGRGFSRAAPDNNSELLDAVRTLPEKYSAVLHLHYYEGYSMKEIANILGIPSATVGTRLARGRDLLRQALKEDTV